VTVRRARRAGLARRQRGAAAAARTLLGIIGLAVLLPALAVAASLGTGGPLDPLTGPVKEVGRTLESSRAALREVQAGIVSADTSLSRAEAGARDGAGLAADVAATMDAMAGAAGVQVLGIAPFAPLVPQLSRTADQARRLSGSLGATADALASERTDMAAVASSTARLIASLDSVGQAEEDSAVPARLALVGVLGWLAALAAWWTVSGFIALGWIRRTRSSARL
jgi:hypothetical protein